MVLRPGMRGDEVAEAQRLLNESELCCGLVVDGIFGPKTEAAVLSFQVRRGLYDDGIIGSRTWAELRRGHENLLLPWVRVPADKYGEGYGSFQLREDVAEQYMLVRDACQEAGALITSSGSKRSLTAPVGSNRSPTSLHYVGRALDLFVYSAMVDPEIDPLVCVQDITADRYWTVWARCEGGEQHTLDGYMYKGRTTKTVCGKFINLTELFARHGFMRIRARKSFFTNPSNNGGAEWWHFQYEGGLVRESTTFGDELLRMYTIEQVSGTPPWEESGRVWGVNWY